MDIVSDIRKLEKEVVKLPGFTINKQIKSALAQVEVIRSKISIAELSRDPLDFIAARLACNDLKDMLEKLK